MFDNQHTEDTFVIPQRRAGSQFREATSEKDIERIGLETADGNQLVDLPIKVNVNDLVPRVFRLPVQAVITATSLIARIFRLKIIFGLSKREKSG